MMFGYACDETPDLMPLPIWLAHAWPSGSPRCARPDAVPYLRPDGKTQVTFEYVDGKPTRLLHVLVSTSTRTASTATPSSAPTSSSR
jgi:S-adenosylmethionine synthetase